MEYKSFEKELLLHSINGYHSLDKEGKLKAEDEKQFEEFCSEYKEFMKRVGSGSFFNRSFQLFFIEGNDFAEFNSRLQKENCFDFIAIGYNGTTEGCFCLKRDQKDCSVYWVYWNEPIPFKIANSFYSWIEKTPKEFFNEKIFKGFKAIKDIKSITKVIDERKKIDLRMLSYTVELSAHPTEQKQYLKRYNLVSFEVIKKQETHLRYLTVKMMRTGSSVGNDNIEYVTLDIQNIAINIPTKVEAFLFDPFNLPFESIICLYEPEIDLGSKMRIKYKEIESFL